MRLSDRSGFVFHVRLITFVASIDLIQGVSAALRLSADTPISLENGHRCDRYPPIRIAELTPQGRDVALVPRCPGTKPQAAEHPRAAEAIQHTEYGAS